ncbi:MAG TPA: sigma-54 dependent transcriptional regulator [bacterium]|nr:sigma-54 dependent transcriptional regulator [bacterium]
MKKTWKILIVDDDVSILRSYQKYLESEGFSVATAKDGEEGFNKTLKERPDIILMDINMPVKTGLELLEDLNRELDTVPLCIMLTAYGDLEAAVRATRLGAYDFLTKPVPLEKLKLSISRGIEKITLTEHVAHVIKDDSEFRDTIVGRDPSMIEIYKTIGTLQGNKATVLICGESGTGKEMVAKAIHDMSSPGTPFIAINCAAIPENLIESELMGYVKGAFTGAVTNREGKFEAVKNGTLLLDEISETPPDFQTKLLRFLQERQYYPVGSIEKRNFNGRIVAATNKNLKALVDAGKFREDLYYRLNVITINVPPLREHMSDFEMLVIHFMKKANAVLHTSLESITREAVDFLKKHNWPGNIRELENVVIKAALNAKDRILTRDSFMFISGEGGRNTETPQQNISAYDLFSKMVTLRDIEKEYIEFVLKQTNWHKGRSAEILGITRPTLDKRIEEFGLVKND